MKTWCQMEGFVVRAMRVAAGCRPASSRAKGSGLPRRDALDRTIFFVAKAAVTIEERGWAAGTEKDQVSLEAFFVDDGSALKRGEDGALGLRQTEAGFDERVNQEGGVNGEHELVQAGVLERGDGNGVAIA